MSKYERYRLVCGDSECLMDPVIQRTEIVVTKPDWVEAYERGNDVEKPYDRKGPTTKAKGYATREQYESEAARVASGQKPYAVYSEFKGGFVGFETPAPPWSQLYQGRNPNEPCYVNVNYPKEAYAAGAWMTPQPYVIAPSFERQHADLVANRRAVEESKPKYGREETFQEAMKRAFDCRRPTQTKN